MEAWIQQSFNWEDEVVRELDPAMLTSVKNTPSNRSTEGMRIGNIIRVHLVHLHGNRIQFLVIKPFFPQRNNLTTRVLS